MQPPGSAGEEKYVETITNLKEQSGTDDETFALLILEEPLRWRKTILRSNRLDAPTLDAAARAGGRGTFLSIMGNENTSGKTIRFIFPHFPPIASIEKLFINHRNTPDDLLEHICARMGERPQTHVGNLLALVEHPGLTARALDRVVALATGSWGREIPAAETGLILAVAAKHENITAQASALAARWAGRGAPQR
jgi:hypothetical protein